MAGANTEAVRIDLHTYNLKEALETFQKAYEEQVHTHAPRPLEVIHGYGSGGEGGVIRSRLRAYLRSQGTRLTFFPGEQVDGNPGYTLVYPKAPLPSVQDVLAEEILVYCRTARSEERIAGRFRRYGEPVVRATLKSLENQGLIHIIYKGKYKCYQAT